MAHVEKLLTNLNCLDFSLKVLPLYLVPDNLRAMPVAKISEFTRNVLQEIKKIPSGKVATYKQIAILAGKPHGSRGVAWILHTCSTTYKLPWHRVLNSQGKISFDRSTHNFRAQLSKLKDEGVEIGVDGSLNLSQFQWKKLIPKKLKTHSNKKEKLTTSKPKIFSR